MVSVPVGVLKSAAVLGSWECHSHRMQWAWNSRECFKYGEILGEVDVVLSYQSVSSQKLLRLAEVVEL